MSLAPKITPADAGSTGSCPRTSVDRLVRACTPDARCVDRAPTATASSSARYARTRAAPRPRRTWRPASCRPTAARARRHRLRPVLLGDVQAPGKRRCPRRLGPRPAPGSPGGSADMPAHAPRPRRAPPRRPGPPGPPPANRSRPARRRTDPARRAALRRAARGRGPRRLRQPAAARRCCTERGLHRPRRGLRHRAGLRHAARPRHLRRHPRRLQRPATSIDPPVRDVLRLGAHQLLATRVGSTPPWRPPSTWPRTSAAAAPSGFVNAVLRRVATRDLDAWIRSLAPDREPGPVRLPGRPVQLPALDRRRLPRRARPGRRRDRGRPRRGTTSAPRWSWPSQGPPARPGRGRPAAGRRADPLVAVRLSGWPAATRRHWWPAAWRPSRTRPASSPRSR